MKLREKKTYTCHHMLHVRITALITKIKIIYRPATFFHPPLRGTRWQLVTKSGISDV